MSSMELADPKATPPRTTANTPTQLLLLIGAAIGGVALRLYMASRGHNYDLESWKLAAWLVDNGFNVYAGTSRYQYGPVWFNILGVLHDLHESMGLARLGPESFHLVVAGFLSLADLGVMLLLWRFFGLASGIFYFLNPLMVLLTGYHSQIDTLALLPAFAAWLVLTRGAGPAGDISLRRLLGSASLLGLSLMTKHILIFFPIWLLMSGRIIPRLRLRLLYALTAYGLFVAAFVPYLFAPNAWEGFRIWVVEYGWTSPNAFLVRLVDLVIPATAVRSGFGFLDDSGFKILMVLSILLFGLAIMRKTTCDPFLCYLPAMLIFSPLMADQYLAIPMITCAVHVRMLPVWIYSIVATWIVQWSAFEHGAFTGPKPFWRNFTGPGLSYSHAIIWLVVLVAMMTSVWPRRWRS